MPAGMRKGLKSALRQENIVPLKSFACSYRLGCEFGESNPLVASEQNKIIIGTNPSPHSVGSFAGTTMASASGA
jgi:hypothetical protein